MKCFCIIMFCVSFSVFPLLKTSHAKTLSVSGSMGTWYADDLRSSYHWGGGVQISGPVDWVEFFATYDRMKVQLKAVDALAPHLKGDSIHLLRLGVNFPIEVPLFGLRAFMYPAAAYVSALNRSHFSHGVAIGTGSEIPLIGDWFALRLEGFKQIYQIPMKANRTSGVQYDLFLHARLVIGF